MLPDALPVQSKTDKLPWCWVPAHTQTWSTTLRLTGNEPVWRQKNKTKGPRYTFFVVFFLCSPDTTKSIEQEEMQSKIKGIHWPEMGKWPLSSGASWRWRRKKKCPQKCQRATSWCPFPAPAALCLTPSLSFVVIAFFPLSALSPTPLGNWLKQNVTIMPCSSPLQLFIN